MTAAIHPVLGLRELSPLAFVLRFERGSLVFRAGQYLRLGLPGGIDRREYSVYSGRDDPYLEVLVRLVEGGLVSGQLRGLRPGDTLAVEGPEGSFVLPDEEGASRRPLLWVASGTGISPFHSFVRSLPSLDYTLLHGVRRPSEFYEHASFDCRRLVACVSGESRPEPGLGLFAGRVTAYLRSHPLRPGTLCYLCGNCDMIYESYAILREQGVPSADIRTEVYF